MRLDIYLTENGYFSSRSKAVFAIKEGGVAVDGKVTLKPSEPVDGKKVEVVSGQLRYVSRGGLKLEGALEAFSLDVAGLICLDLGASTGGFTDCLLQNGADKVYALDVEHGQLDGKLRNDSRVIVMEHFNAREMNGNTFSEKMDAVVSDLSFISQKLIYPAVASVLKDGGIFVSLIKPQFEAGRGFLNKKGIVTDKNVHCRVISSLIADAAKNKLYLERLAPSPIAGGDGNREYLGLFRYDGNTEKIADIIPDEMIRKTVFSKE